MSVAVLVASAPILSALDPEMALIVDDARLSSTSRTAIFCADIATSSPTHERPWQRALRRANKLKQGLGMDVGIDEPYPEKPRGMWARTYGGLLDEILQAEILTYQAQANRFQQLSAQVDNDQSDQQKGRRP
jgi:hypothetical protein